MLKFPFLYYLQFLDYTGQLFWSYPPFNAVLYTVLFFFIKKLQITVNKEMTLAEVQLSKLTHVDGEGRITQLITDYHGFSVRVSESITLWDQYVSVHSSFDDDIVAFNSWLARQSFKTTPPTSLENCQQTLSQLQVCLLCESKTS